MTRKNLSRADAAWLHMEDPTNLMMINGFFHVAGELDYARVRATVEHRLLTFDRFRQRVVESRLPFRPPYWETDPNFDLDAHLHKIALPAPGDDAALRELISDLAAMPLDNTKPLWQFHIIEGYKGGGLLFGRLHHCIADGIALTHLLLSLCDEDADAPWPEPDEKNIKRRHGRRNLRNPVTGAYRLTKKISETVTGEGIELIRHPLEPAKDVAAYAKGLGRITFLPPDPNTIFKGKLGVSKRAAWSEPLPLSEVKEFGRSLGGTINDVLLTLVTGALRRYLLAKDQAVDGIEIRAMIPVNMRPPEQVYKLGNYFGLVVLTLPINIEDPLERLLVLSRRMDELKHSAEPVVGLTVVQAMGVVPAGIEQLGTGFFTSKTTAIMTNVPGPRQKLYFAGERVEKFMAWVPQSGRVGMGVSIFSYAGEVVLGFLTDAGLVPDPEAIIEEFYKEFEAIKGEIGEIEASAYRGEVPVVDDEERGRCMARTKADTRCKNRTIAGSAYCHVHAKIVADSEDIGR